MRHFPRLPPDLPPLLRVVSILGLLFPLAGLALGGFAFVAWWSSSAQSPYANGMPVIALNLNVLGLACISAVGNYRTRFLQPDRGPYPLRSWQSRMRAIGAAAALSICALVLAAVIPPTAETYLIVDPISIVGVVIVGVASISMIDRW